MADLRFHRSGKSGRGPGSELPCDEFDTFGGYVFAKYGYIPEDGASFTLDADQMHIEVLQISEHRILSAMVTLTRETDAGSKFQD